MPDAADIAAGPFLGVERSATGKRWCLRPAVDRTVRALAQRHGLSDTLSRVLVARGIGLEEAATHLNPTLKALLPDPFVLKDMDRTTERLVRAIAGDEPIAIFGDYDVDGATSTALWVRYLRALGRDARIYIPDRLAEGYGPNAPALEALARDGIGLVITVDCGITAFEALQRGRAAGLDIIVIDHHAAESRLPPATAIVNPNRLDDDSGLGQLAACGVVFATLVALNRRLRDEGWFAGRAEPNLLGLLDLVALGTICDVVPLVGLNRALVVQGLKVLEQRGNTGLAALIEVAAIRDRLSAYHAGYLLGPRINAAGRIGEADLGARLMSTEDPGEAAVIARKLDAHNLDRRAIEQAVLDEAIAAVEAGGHEDETIIVLDGEDWHPGVIGIIAGRLRERYDRPVCVLGWEGDTGKASGRSMPGIDLGAAVIEARNKGLLLSGGGHPMAAGFTVERHRLADLRAFLAAHVTRQAAGPLVPVLDLDAALGVAAASPDLALDLERLGPYGAGNEEPRFVLADTRVVSSREVGSGHLQCILADATGARLKAIAFRALGTPLGDSLLAAGAMPLHVAGTLKVDRWQGRKGAQFQIEDVAS